MGRIWLWFTKSKTCCRKIKNALQHMCVSYVKNFIIVGLIILFAGIVIYIGTCSSGNVPYVPVVLVVENGNHKYQYDSSLSTPEFMNNFCKVLDFYGEYYVRKENNVYISRRLSDDEELLANYTNKAKIEKNIPVNND